MEALRERLDSAGRLPRMPTSRAPHRHPHPSSPTAPLTSDRDRRRAWRSPFLGSTSGQYLASRTATSSSSSSIGDRPSTSVVPRPRTLCSSTCPSPGKPCRRRPPWRRRRDLLDDRSLNGVVVNHERVREAVLSHGDEIRLGDVAMRFLDLP